jgi:hypothetical protein
VSVTYTCDICGVTSSELMDNLMGQENGRSTLWQMHLCGDLNCLVTALTKMHEPQGIKAFQYYKGWRERERPLDDPKEEL